jgi:hypothetical protein
MKISITATHDAIRGTTHQHRTHGHIDEGISQKIELTDRHTAVSSAILETAEDDYFFFFLVSWGGVK